MQRRSISFTTIRRKIGRKKDAYGALDNVAGVDLLHQFYAWAQAIDPNRLRNERLGKYAHVERVEAHGRSVLVTVDSGLFGEAGNTWHVYNHEVSHQRTADEASAARSRLIFIVPEGSTLGIFGVESVGGASGASILIDEFAQDCRARWDADYWPTDRVYERDDWLALADLKQLKAVYYRWSNNLEDGLEPRRVVGRMERNLFPAEEGGFLPRPIWQALFNGNMSASAVIGVEVGDDDADNDPDIVFANVTRNGRDKTVELGNGKTPTVREIMTNTGEPPLDDLAFLHGAVDAASQHYEGMTGQALPLQLVTGRWDDEALGTEWG